MDQGRLWRVLLACSMLATVGCLGAGEGPEADAAAGATNETDEAADAPAIDHEEHAQAARPAAASQAAVDASEALTSLHQMQLYFTSDLELVDEVPEPGSVAFPATWSSCFTSPPCAHLAFESAPMSEPWALVPGPVVYDIWVVSDVPIASTTLFDFGGWFGTDVGLSAFSMTLHGNILPGEPARITWEAEHPETPNVLFPGDSFAALVLAAMTQEIPGTLHLLTGGETPSSISYTMARVDPAALTLGAETTETLAGTLQGPAWPTTEATGHGDRTVAVHPIEVPEDAQLLRIDIAGSSPAGGVDVDVDLMDGERVVGSGHTPRATETMQLAGPALDGLRGKTLDLRVVLFFGADVSYTVDVTFR